MLYSQKIFAIFVIFSALLLNCNSKEELKSRAEILGNSKTEKHSELNTQPLNAYAVKTEYYQKILDSLILKNPNEAYNYQQKAMLLYKQDKDELGLPFLEKAAALDPVKYVDYMAFMKCIFSKNYKDAIVDFNKSLALNGESYVMDHSYYFYLGLCNLQLNEFEKAKDYFEKSIAQSIKEDGEEWIHFTDLMYLGIANYELNNFEEAIKIFDEALILQPKFSDVKYYKSRCLRRLGEIEKAKNMFEESKKDFLNDDILYEDNTIYERYPYQVRKSWFGL